MCLHFMCRWWKCRHLARKRHSQLLEGEERIGSCQIQSGPKSFHHILPTLAWDEHKCIQMSLIPWTTWNQKSRWDDFHSLKENLHVLLLAIMMKGTCFCTEHVDGARPNLATLWRSKTFLLAWRSCEAWKSGVHAPCPTWSGSWGLSLSIWTASPSSPSSPSTRLQYPRHSQS